jgi:hypothetical protein
MLYEQIIALKGHPDHVVDILKKRQPGSWNYVFEAMPKVAAGGRDSWEKTHPPGQSEKRKDAKSERNRLADEIWGSGYVGGESE